MKWVYAIVLVLASAATAGSASAFTDDFDSYATGPLSVVSGGVWNTFGGIMTDAMVTDQGLSLPNAMYHDGINLPDVVAFWDDLFAGGCGVLSYDFLVHEEGQDDMETFVLVGSGDPGTLETTYDSAIGAFIIDWGASAGAATLHMWDVDGVFGGGDYGVIELATGLTLDRWYHVELQACITVPDRTANDPGDPDGQFEVWLDGAPVLGPTGFGLDPLLGWNAVEVYSFDSGGQEPEWDDYTLIDNFRAVPEPSVVVLIGLGVVAMLRRKK